MAHLDKKYISALVLSAVLTVSQLTPVSAEETAVSASSDAAVTEISAISEEVSSNDDAAVSEVSSITTVSVTEPVITEEQNGFYTDDYFDTEGNATLIKKEKIIYDSEEMQFIAVTTKDGSVFYVLINYSAAGEDDNVYFLNKVDDYDLYALLYAEQNKDTAPDEAAVLAAEKVDEYNSAEEENPAETNVSESDVVSQPESGMNMNYAIIVLVFVLILAAAAFAVYKLIFKKKPVKKTSQHDFDDEDDFDFNDEV